MCVGVCAGSYTISYISSSKKKVFILIIITYTLYMYACACVRACIDIHSCRCIQLRRVCYPLRAVAASQVGYTDDTLDLFGALRVYTSTWVCMRERSDEGVLW